MQNNRITRTLLLVLTTLIYLSCKEDKPITAEINPAFEKDPPIAADIRVQLLPKKIDSNNVLLTAVLDTGKIKSMYHAVMLGDQKFILRDDGKKGDARKQDGIYSIAIKEDEAELKADLGKMYAALPAGIEGGRPIWKWVNRSAIQINDELRKTDLRPDLVKGFKFEPGIFNLLADPLLKDHSLTITDLGVVEDPTRTFNPCTGAGTPNGAWTFSKLMQDMANTPATGVTAENLIKDWIETYMVSTTVNSDPVARNQMETFFQIIKPWVLKSNPAVPPQSVNFANWKTFTLDLTLAPVKLLAIVNRIDLRGNTGYGMNNPGEGRFVFGFVSNICTAIQFTVILEYGLPMKTCSSLQGFASQWYALKDLTPGSTAYNNALQIITDQFTAAGAGGTKPNGSCLNQLRSDEILNSDDHWQIREYNLDNATHKLFVTTVKQTPAEKYNGANIIGGFPVIPANIPTLASYVNSNQASIINNTYTVPLSYGGLPFLGGKVHNTFFDFWNGTVAAGPGLVINDQARHVFSLNTCNGCHGGETKTGFTHVKPASWGSVAQLSKFLTGDPADPQGLFRVTDPAGRPSGSPAIRGFNDLERRAQDLEAFLATSCRKKKTLELARVLSFKPLGMTH
jgi:hypothetical protein